MNATFSEAEIKQIKEAKLLPDKIMNSILSCIGGFSHNHYDIDRITNIVVTVIKVHI